MKRFGKFAVLGIMMLGFSLAFSLPAFAQEGETIAIGGSVSGTFGATYEQIVYPLDLAAGELVTLLVTSENGPGTLSSSLYYEILDAEGNYAQPVAPTFSVFRADGALPYTLTVNGYNTSYKIDLEAGNTLINERGTAVLDSQITGQLTGQQYDVYTLDAQAGDLVTMRYTNTHFIPELYAAEIPDSSRVDNRIIRSLATADQMEVDPFYISNRIVYRIVGEPPYELFVSTTQTTPGEVVSYDITLESGDTLERESFGTLAAGQRIEGLLPDENGTYYYIQLDVEAGKTYTVQQWADVDVSFLIVDSDLTWVPEGEAPPINFRRFEVSEDNVLPLYLMIESAVWNTGEPFIFTLAEGEEALAPDAAELATPDDATQSTTEETAPPPTEEVAVATAACFVVSIGESRQRVGPGTNYESTGLMAPGATTEAIGQATGTDGRTWWQLAESVWVRSDLVNETGDCEAVPVVAAP